MAPLMAQPQHYNDLVHHTNRRLRWWCADEPFLTIIMVVGVYHIVAAALYPELQWKAYIALLYMIGVNGRYVYKYMLAYDFLRMMVASSLLMQVSTIIYLICGKWYYTGVALLILGHVVHQSVTAYLYLEYCFASRQRVRLEALRRFMDNAAPEWDR